MGREVRKVPANWQHPKYSEHEIYEHPYREGRFKPLQTGYASDAEGFLAMANEKGLQEAIDYYGRAPDVNDYMPDWPEAECTHLMMYENTSEGTPLTPAFATPEELARYCADNGVSAFGSSKATYEQWLSVAKGGWAPSAVIENGVMKSGVEALA